MRILVIGAGGAGLKVVQAVTDSHESGRGEHDIVGFIDDNPVLKGTDFFGYPVLGSTSELAEIEERTGPFGEIGLVCVIGEPAVRQRVLGRVSDRFKSFPNITHPSAQVSRFADVGKGNLFGQNAVIQAGATVGDFNVFDVGTLVGSWAAVVEYCTLNNHAVVSCHSTVDSYTVLGSGSIVINDIVVGSHSTIAPNSFVTRSLEQSSKVMGVPARKMG